MISNYFNCDARAKVCSRQGLADLDGMAILALIGFSLLVPIMGYLGDKYSKKILLSALL